MGLTDFFLSSLGNMVGDLMGMHGGPGVVLGGSAGNGHVVAW